MSISSSPLQRISPELADEVKQAAKKGTHNDLSFEEAVRFILGEHARLTKIVEKYESAAKRTPQAA